jgi:hypothetical protein
MGGPARFFEMLKIVPLLTDPAAHGGDPADSFDLVVPSLPGFGFSGRPLQRGMNAFRFVDAERLLKRFVAQELILSFVPEAEQRLWRTVVRRKYQLTRDRVRLQNLLNKHRSSRGIFEPVLLGPAARETI